MENLECIITEKYTIMQALECLDRVKVKVLFIVCNDRFCATLTDGDVRRAILRGVPLTALVKEIANYNPYYVKRGERMLGLQLLKEKQIQALPIVDDDLKIVGICKHEDDDFGKMDHKPVVDIPVVIMAGGLGTRLYPYTKVLPKPLIPIVDTPISERIIQSFQEIGCNDFHMILNYKKNMIKAYFTDTDKNYNIHFYEEMTPLGTGGGVRLLIDQIHSTFILTNCDILILDDVKKMVDHHREQNNQVTMVCSLKNFEIPYGVVKFTEGGEISSFEEKPKMSFFTNTGYYILEPTVFGYIGENEQISMPDIITRMKTDGKKVGIYPISENSWLDMGQMDTMESMERKVKELNII